MEKRKWKTGVLIGRIASVFLLLLIYPMAKSGDAVLCVANVMIIAYWWGVRRLDD